MLLIAHCWSQTQTVLIGIPFGRRENDEFAYVLQDWMMCYIFCRIPDIHGRRCANPISILISSIRHRRSMWRCHCRCCCCCCCYCCCCCGGNSSSIPNSQTGAFPTEWATVKEWAFEPHSDRDSDPMVYPCWSSSSSLRKYPEKYRRPIFVGILPCCWWHWRVGFWDFLKRALVLRAACATVRERSGIRCQMSLSSLRLTEIDCTFLRGCEVSMRARFERLAVWSERPISSAQLPHFGLDMLQHAGCGTLRTDRWLCCRFCTRRLCHLITTSLLMRKERKKRAQNKMFKIFLMLRLVYA